MHSAFSPAANFNGMMAADSPGDLFLSLVVHQAFIEVNEEGTEAAAATAWGMVLGGPAGPEPFTPHFCADRPFLYLIRHRESGSILFLGRMMQP